MDEIPDYLDKLFLDGKRLLSESTFYDADDDEESDGFLCRLEVHQVGLLSLPSGWIMLSDPHLLHMASPLAAAVEPGDYPVSLSVAHIPEQEDARIAGLRIGLRAGHPVAWAPAMRGDGEPAFGVDSGLACVVDADNDQFRQRMGEAFEALSRELETSEQPCPWGRWGPSPHGPFAILAFPAGFGDGFYSSWWGLDAEGLPVCLVTDFRVLGE